MNLRTINDEKFRHCQVELEKGDFSPIRILTKLSLINLISFIKTDRRMMILFLQKNYRRWNLLNFKVVDQSPLKEIKWKLTLTVERQLNQIQFIEIINNRSQISIDVMKRPDKIQAQKLIGTKFGQNKVVFTEKDAILYALGIGFSTDPMRDADYKYTNELNEQFTVFSTYGCMVSKFDPISPLLESQHMPQFSPFIILHAEQRLVIVQNKITPGVEYTSQSEIVDVLDKGKNALVVFRHNTFTQNNGKQELAFYNEMTLLLRGYGGFGFKGKGVTPSIPKIPQSKPDHVIKATSFPGQAFVYRLSGDINPLHIDPNIAAIQKFEKPIIHGLASYGIVARAISQQLLDNDSNRIGSYHARFIGHVFPGESYEIQVWKNGNKWVFLASVIQRQSKALVGELEIKPEAKL